MVKTTVDKIEGFQALRGIAFLGVFLCYCGIIWPNFWGWLLSVVLSVFYKKIMNKSFKQKVTL